MPAAALSAPIGTAAEPAVQAKLVQAPAPFELPAQAGVTIEVDDPAPTLSAPPRKTRRSFAPAPFCKHLPGANMLLTRPPAMRKSTIDIKRDRPGNEVNQRLDTILEAVGVLNNMNMSDGENFTKIVALPSL